MPPKSKKQTKTKKIKKKLSVPEQGISKPAIMRILYRAGVKSTSSLVYDEFRRISMKLLGQVVRRAALYTNNRKKSTINEKDVISSLKTLGLTYLSEGGAGNTINDVGITFKIKVTKSKSKKRKTPKKSKKGGPPRATHRFKSGTVSLRSIRRYQKSTEFLIRRSPVKYIIRSLLDRIKITGQYLNLDGSEFRIGKTAVDVFQTALEYHLVNIANRALLLALNAKRTRLQLSDVRLVNSIISISRN